jgi:hypothetical protein
MMFGMLVIGAILIYLLLEPTYNEDNKLWLTGIIGAVLSIVGVYNFFVSRGPVTAAGFWSYCSFGGGYRAGLITLIGIILLAATGIAWLKSDKKHRIANEPSDQELP